MDNSNWSSYELSTSAQYVSTVKKILISCGVIIHADMTTPSSSYEEIVDGVGSFVPRTAMSVTTRLDEESFASYILANEYKHVAFYQDIFHRACDTITKEDLSYHIIRYAAW